MRSHWEYALLDRLTGKEESATLFSPIAENNVADFETKWRPAMRAKIAGMKTQQEVLDANLQDEHWNWRGKYEDRSNRIDWESFAVECGGGTEGLMFVSNSLHPARVASQANLPMVYIDILSTAPWNRHGFCDTPRYKGVGHLLLAAALSLSEDEGFDRRLGLHSLPQSESWYRDVCKFTDLGPDSSYYGLVYFEFTTKQADAYLDN